MGRNYFGDISGKFWFGIQCSNDIEKLIPKINESHSIKYCWLGCGCRVNLGKDMQPNTDYCHCCYEGKINHLADVLEFEGNPDIMYEEDNHFHYDIGKEDHYNQLCDSLFLLSSQLPPNIFKEFNGIEVIWDDSMLDIHSGVYERIFELSRTLCLGTERENNNMREIIARYGHGLQVKYCLEKLGTCTFTAEI